MIPAPMTAAPNRVALCQSIKLLKVAFNFYSSQLLCRPTVQSSYQTPLTHTLTNTKQWDVANKTKAAIFTRRQAKTSKNKLNITRSAESERKKDDIVRV